MGNKVGMWSLIFVWFVKVLLSEGFFLFLRVVMVLFSMFIYKLKLMLVIWFDWLLFKSLLVLWIFKLCVVSVNFVFKFFNWEMVFRCLIVFFVICLGCGVSK